MIEKVSVIVPVWNREKLIIRCLESILNQTERPFELIVVDNASTDSSYNNIRHWMTSHSDSGIKFQLLREETKGAWCTRQTGFRHATGDWVLFFDSDDEMMPDLLEQVSRVLKNHQVDVICWKCRIDQLDKTVRIPPFDWEKPLENHLIHTLLRPQGYIIRKDFFEKTGGWNKKIPVWNDLELGLRILLQNPKVLGINEVLARIYSQVDSITGIDFSSKEGLWEDTLNEMERETIASRHPSKKRILKILDYRRVILAAHYYKEGNQEGADSLLTATLKNKGWKDKLVLKFSYNFTKQGMRGAWRIVKYFI